MMIRWLIVIALLGGGLAFADDAEIFPPQICDTWPGDDINYQAPCLQAVRQHMPQYWKRVCGIKPAYYILDTTPSIYNNCPVCCSNSYSYVRTNFFQLGSVEGGDTGGTNVKPFETTGMPGSLAVSRIESSACLVVQYGTNLTQLVPGSNSFPVQISRMLGQTNWPDVAGDIAAGLDGISHQQLSNLLLSLKGATNADDRLYLGDTGTNGEENARWITSNTWTYPYMGYDSNPANSNYFDAFTNGMKSSQNLMGGGSLRDGSSSSMIGKGGSNTVGDLSGILESNTSWEDGGSFILTNGSGTVRDSNLIIDFRPMFTALGSIPTIGAIFQARSDTVPGRWIFNVDPLQFKGIRFVVLIVFTVTSLFIFKWGIDKKMEIIESWVKLAHILDAVAAPAAVGVDLVKDVIHWIKRGLEKGASLVVVASIASFVSIVLDGHLVWRSAFPSAGSVLPSTVTSSTSLGGGLFPAVQTGSSLWTSALVLLYILFPVRTLFTVICEIWLLRTGMMTNVAGIISKGMKTIARFL